MKPARPAGGRDKPAAPQQPPPSTTPNTDMQAEDAGTGESGSAQEEQGDSATAANRAMKQTSKTPHEGGQKKR